MPKQGTSHAEALAALEAAAAPVLEAIRCEAHEAPAPLDRVLEYIADHLLDQGFNAAQALREVGVTDSHARLRFHNGLGLPPAAYILDARMQVAAQLLVATQLSAARLSELVGYGKPESFARAFKRWSGARPSAFRLRWREASGLGSSTQPFLSRSFRARAAAGQLDHPELTTLLTRFRALYPQSAKIPQALEEVELATVDPSPPSPDPAESIITKSWQLPVLSQPFDLLAVEQPKATKALRLLDQVGFHEALHRVRNWRFRSPALFEALSQRSIDVGRQYRPAAVPWMKLALASIEGIDAQTCTTRERGSLRVLALARLGNSMRLAFDYQAAERILGMATAELKQSRPDEEVESEVETMVAGLLWCQRRIPQALARVERALRLHRFCSSSGEHGRTLLLYGNILFDDGQHGREIAPFHRARRVAGDAGDVRTALRAEQSLSASLATAGSFSEAESLIASLRERAQALGDLDLKSQIDWTEARVQQKQGHMAYAAQLLLRARSNLEQMGHRGNVASITGELALVRLRQGRRQEAEQCARMALHDLKEMSCAMGTHQVTTMVRAVLSR